MAIKENKNEEKISILHDDLALLESYAQDLFSFFPLAFCLVSPQGIILEVNPALEKLTGYELVEIIGSSIEKLFGEEEAQNLSTETLEKGYVRGKETTLFTKDKRKIPVSISTQLRKSKEGEITGYFMGAFDLIDIKKYEKELKESQLALMNILEDTRKEREKAEEARKAVTNILEDIEEERKKTQAIISHFTDGVLVFDNKNILSSINPQAQRILGVEPQEVLGRLISWLSEFLPFKALIEALGEKEIQPLSRKEFSLTRPSKMALELTTVPIIELGEKWWLVILHDISREKLIERMKTEFVSLAAHQLRTPLSAIKWTLRMLLDGDLGKITEEQRGFIEKTYESNERMISLINALLDVTRIEEGRYIYKPVFAQIENIVQFVINSFKEEIGRKKIKLEFKKPRKKLPEVKVDVEKVRLVINNLLDNAIRYTPVGGKVTTSLKCGKKEIELSVQDTGVGIPEDQKKRVFTKFFRGANVMRMETEGTGLGLFITKNIIEAHGGRIWFESEEDKGSTFHFTIPIKEEFAEFLKKF